MPTGVPVTMSLLATPNSIMTCPGTILLKATVKDSSGNIVPDGTVVTFIANGGTVGRVTALTTKGIATNTLAIDPPGTSDTPIYNVSASAGILVASTNVQAVCNATPVPTSSVQCSTTTGSANAVKACKTAIAGAPPPPQAPINGVIAPTIKPPYTGNAGLGH
jgi:hypothetical protein